jgi:2-phospho-L-lactate transferase/gluconeogenesis factor (CofD/UPF0052 family)
MLWCTAWALCRELHAKPLRLSLTSVTPLPKHACMHCVSVLQAIQGCDAVVYGMGSLYTSICPTLILEGVGEAIAARQDALKVY